MQGYRRGNHSRGAVGLGDEFEPRRRAVIAVLVAAGASADRAIQYADAFIEYSAAGENIRNNGLIVGHPRTGNPIENPYLAVRDRALRKLQRMRDVPTGDLWIEGAP